ncbi:MAG: class I SAM-dependent methyltransferase [Alphaproteobacteria bacterium]
MSDVFTFDDFDAANAQNTSSNEIILKLLSSTPFTRPASTLDIGCGQGKFADKLACLGFRSFGLEPQANLAKMTTENGASVLKGFGENLPFENAHFDLVMFGHSLHHVPLNKLNAALQEALRVLKPDGNLIVTEPLSVGPFYTVMQPVDDEAPLYRAVEKELTSLVASNQINHKGRTYTQANPSYQTFKQLKDVLVGVTPERGNAPTEDWVELERRFLAQPISETSGKRHLLNFSRVDVFTKP